jgi:hypothetical protein
MSETAAPEADVTPSVTLLPAVTFDAVLASEVAEVLPILTLARLDTVHVLRLETRVDAEGTRCRMRCDCGRNSYLAPWANPGELPGVLPTPVREALRRHNRRALGKAMRVIKADAKLIAELAALRGEEPAEPGRDVAAEFDATNGEAPRYANVTIGRGAVTHLTENGDATLCGKTGELTERTGSSTCRTCEAAAE